MLKTHQHFSSQEPIAEVRSSRHTQKAYKKYKVIVGDRLYKNSVSQKVLENLSARGIKTIKKPSKKMKRLLSEETGCTRQGGESEAGKPIVKLKKASKRLNSAGHGLVIFDPD